MILAILEQFHVIFVPQIKFPKYILQKINERLRDNFKRFSIGLPVAQQQQHWVMILRHLRCHL